MTNLFEGPKEEHPFARYVRILGKGKSGSRSLSAEEAETALAMILRGSVEPLQLGAFLMLLRVKEESPAELTGFVQACRSAITPARLPFVVDLDWSSYAGKKSQQPWYLLSALLLAENGIKILMHGADGHTPDRIYSEEVLLQLGISPAINIDGAGRQIQESGFAFLPLRNFCRPLHDIMQYRHLLGLRSPVNTLARLLNPARAHYSIQSVFHPSYAALHRAADIMLAQPNSMVFKGEGGEVEIKPHAETQCLLQRGGHTDDLVWERSLEIRPGPETRLNARSLVDLWQTGGEEGYGALAVIHTCASALVLLEKAADSRDAIRIAGKWWQMRDRGRRF